MLSHSPNNPAPQTRLVTIGMVAGIHAMAIAGLILALHPQIVLPHAPGPIDVRMDVPRQVPHMLAPTLAPTLSAPQQITILHPVIVLAPQTADVPHAVSPVATHPFVQTGPTTAPDNIFVAAQGIAGTHTTPAYPPLAVRLNEQGDVRLALEIDINGRVTSAQVVASSGHDELDTAAIAWVEAHWRYRPASRDGKPVPATTEAVVTFRLNGRG
ncbi:MAG TPA: energy transducer TonB [Rhizomicrobium sp.]|jgi:protein TonB